MERESRELWAKRVERWKDSGLSATEFASEVGVNAKSLTWWRWRLSNEDAKLAVPRRRASRSKAKLEEAAREPSPAVTFVEVPSATPSSSLEIGLPSTTLFVRVRAGFDDATLSRVLDILERRR